jgi:DNA-binding NarL/FixJ family response regulator
VAAADQRSRERFVRLFREAGHEVTSEAAGRDVLASMTVAPPALVTIDFRLSDMWGYELCHRLRERFGDSLSLALIAPEDRAEPYDRVAALLIGADECFTRPFDESEFLVHVERLMSRTAAFEETELAADLTPRELEVLQLLAGGIGPESIAEELYISRRTVDTHVQNILRKLSVHSRTEAVALAYRFGLMAPSQAPEGDEEGGSETRATTA